jgi:hypothetical protein
MESELFRACPSKQKRAGEPCERRAVHIPETHRAEPPAESHPSHCTKRVANVNRSERNHQKPNARFADRSNNHSPTKSLERDGIAEPINEIAQGQNGEQK